MIKTRKSINYALLSVGVVSVLGLIVVLAYMRKVNQDAATPASYEEVLLARLKATEQDPFITYIPEGLRGTDEVPEVTADDPIYGNANADVSIIAFTDMECPACADVDPLLRKAVDGSGGRLRLVWKDFPIPRIHKQSEEAAEAARCAGDQGKFWEYTEDLFANQLLLGEGVYQAAAEEENLDLSSFDSCRASDRMLALIQRDYLTGRSFQVDETPTLYVGRRRLVGSISPDELEAAVDQALSR